MQIGGRQFVQHATVLYSLLPKDEFAHCTCQSVIEEFSKTCLSLFSSLYQHKIQWNQSTNLVQKRHILFWIFPSMHHVLLCTKTKIRWSNAIVFVGSLSYMPCFSCCMPVSLHLSLSRSLSCVFVSVLDDAFFASLCHVSHHQEHPHLPLRSFHSPAPFFVCFC